MDALSLINATMLKCIFEVLYLGAISSRKKGDFVWFVTVENNVIIGNKNSIHDGYENPAPHFRVMHNPHPL